MMAPLSDDTRQRLRELSQRLLRLHKTLLDLQRREYESDHLPPSSGSELLRLVLDHPDFAWLRTLSALIVEIDDLVSSDELATEGDAQAKLTRVQSLLHTANGEPGAFTSRYRDALQASPDVVVAHGQVMALFPA